MDRVKRLRLLLPFVALLVCTSTAPAEDSRAGEVFESDGLMRAETRWLVDSLERLHFSEITLADLEMSEVIESYMEALDYNHLYFTQEDRDAFVARFAGSMERYLRSGNIHPAFQIFSVFQERALEKAAWVDEYLKRDFTFSDELVYQADREDSPWPANESEIEDLWERRIQFELLNEVISRMQPPPSESGEAGDEAEETEPLSFEEALAEAKEVVGKRYDRLDMEMKRFEAQEVQEIFLTTLSRNYDPHSVFLSADSLEDLSIAIENSLVGIGAVLQDNDGYCTIRELIPGGPASLSGEIDVDDQIVGVGQGEDGEFVDVVDMKLRRIVKMIRGEKDSIVRLKIRPAEAADPSARKVVVLERDEVELTANLAKARLYQVPVEDRTVPIGVIDLPSFYGSENPDHPDSSEDVAELIGKLEARGMKGLILDLRFNGGGLLGEAVDLAGLFIPEGPVVQVKTVQGDLMHHDDRDGSVEWAGPLIVLVSKHTASASEIVAGALQNYDRALVVGDESTHGKGTVQGIFRMTPPLFYALSSSGNEVGATKVTVQKYYLPNGESTQLEGVKADVAIPSMNDFRLIGESDLDNSLAWDTIRPLEFDLGKRDDRLSLVTVDPSLVELLRDKSLSRRDRLEEFSLLEESIDFFRERREQEEISLNLDERQRQQKEDLALQASFRERRDRLSEKEFSYVPILLDHEIALETEGKAKEEEEEEESLDIVLREGIRIMTDWLSVRLAEDSEAEKEVPLAQTKLGS